MKRILFLIAFTVLTSTMWAQYGTPVYDTVFGRDSRWYVTQWYDTCPVYFMGSFRSQFGFAYLEVYAEGHYDNLIAIKEYTPHPIRISGLSVMAVGSDEDINACDIAMPRILNHEKVPEYVMLFQEDASQPTGVRLVDSGRWDNADVQILRLPCYYDVTPTTQDTNSDKYHLFIQCHLFTVNFKHPVTVDSSFYVASTMLSNVLNEGFNVHIPTIFIVGDEYTMDHCKKCRDEKRREYIGKWPNFVGFDTINPNNNFGLPYFFRSYYTYDADSNRVYHPHSTFGPFFPILDTSGMTLHAFADDPTMGRVTGGGVYDHDTVVTITATPNEGYHFLHWSDMDTVNPRQVHLVSDTIIAAIFEADIPEVGIDEMAQQDGFSLTPNPAHDVLILHSASEEPFGFTLYDAAGRRLMQRQYATGGSYSIDVADLAAGTYLVAFSTREVATVKTFVKQ